MYFQVFSNVTISQRFCGTEVNPVPTLETGLSDSSECIISAHVCFSEDKQNCMTRQQQ